MSNGFEKAAGELLSAADGRKIAEKKAELEKLASSGDARELKGLMGGELEKAVRSGDADAVRGAVESALKTPAGARLARELMEMFGK